MFVHLAKIPPACLGIKLILHQDPPGMLEAPQANNHHAGNYDKRTSEDSDMSLLLQAPNEALLCP